MQLQMSNWMMMLPSMKWWIGLAVLLVVAYFVYTKGYQGTKYYANREHVPESDANSTKTATMMLFYTNWCPHCKTAKPEWESIKSQYEGQSINGYHLMFMEYDCESEMEDVKQIVDKYQPQGYPTVKLLKDNQVIDFDANPTKATLEEFLNTVL